MMMMFFDRLFDRVGLAMAFGSEAKADRAMMVAKERLAETEKMMASNKLGAAGIAQAGHGDALEVVRHSLRRMRSDNPDASLESQIEFEAELEEHEIEINHVRDGLKLRLELKDGLSESQLSVIDSLISLLQNQTGKVKADIEGEKDRLKLKIKSSEGKSEVEFEAEIRGLEEKAGLVGLRRERAVEQIDEALEEIAEAKDMMFGRNLSNLTGGAAIAELVSQAEMKIADARAAFSDGRFGEAFGLAESAEQLAKNAKRQLERAISVSEDSSGRNGVGDERLEIKAELFNSTSEVKVELRFTAASTDRVGAISELLSRLNLTKEDINRLLDLENETEDERDFNNRLKTEIKTKEGLASVRFELEFPLNTTSRADIVDSIFSRLSSLTKDDLERR
ncbi:hypothetical protein HYU12_04185 [Candidatus Woesearchaeota archaeon]|nr:hypothetical protein [Candidatus Woesearchaeota archaeon]